MSTEPTTIRWEQDETGVVTLVLDDPNQSANTMNAAFRASLAAITDRLEAEKDSIRGVIFTSAKKTFFAGGDLRDLIRVTPETAQDLFDGGLAIKRNLRRIETLGKPVVAAINGAALGGGFELALACHHRVALDTSGTKIGCPEVTLGLLPGGGGIVRTVRLLGIADALLKVLLQGTQYNATRARDNGLVHEVAATPEELLVKARAFIDANPESQQPWDVPGYRIPGGTPANPKFAANLPAFPASLRKQTNGAPYPAPRNILAAAVEGSQVDFETAQVIEARYFVELAAGQTSKNMIQAFFFDLQAVNSGANRPKGIEPRPVRRVAVLGAGMMGAGIAYSCALAGDGRRPQGRLGRRGGQGQGVLREALRQGGLPGPYDPGEGRRAARPDHAHRRPERPRGLRRGHRGGLRGHLAQAQGVPGDPAHRRARRPALLQHLHPADHRPRRRRRAAGGLHRAALLLARRQDAAGGDHQGRAHRRRGTGPRLRPGPPDQEDPDRRQRLAGLLHLPGHRPLHQRGRGDGRRGRRARLRRAGRRPGGYPAKVLSLMDELTLTLPRKIRKESKQAVEEAGGTWETHPAEAVIDRMVDEFERPGRSGGAGFYEYGEDGRRGLLWPGLREHFTKAGYEIPFEDMKERMLFSEALDTVRLLEEGVLTSVADANIGSILGIGFPGWTGGVLQYINGYEGGTGTGPAAFVARARELAERYGDRFLPCGAARREGGEGRAFHRRGLIRAARAGVRPGLYPG